MTSSVGHGHGHAARPGEPTEVRLSAAAERMFYCPAQAGLFMPPAQLGSPSDIAIPIMLHGSCIKFIHLK